MSSVYHINKGINKPIEFKGLRAQYIAYLAIGLVGLLISFAVLYISGLNLFILLPMILGLGAGLFFTVFHLSHKFGQHGLMKYFAKRNLPGYLKINSRKVFIRLKKEANDTY
jgi:disulfide bond formation protein DsbB